MDQVKFAEHSLYNSLKGYGLLKFFFIPSNFFKGHFPQILLGPFLNTLSQMSKKEANNMSSNDHNK